MNQPTPNPLPAKGYCSVSYVLLLTVVPLLLFAGWSLCDGLHAYPQQRKIALEFERIKVAHPFRWRAIRTQGTQARGWPTQDPGPPKSERVIAAQFVQAGACSFLSLPLIVVAFVFYRLT